MILFQLRPPSSSISQIIVILSSISSSSPGDLQKALNKSAEERLDEERVRFYVAENVIANVDDDD